MVPLHVTHAQGEFITIWKTNNPGTSLPNQINFSAGDGFLFDIAWEEVGNPSNSGFLTADFFETIITFPNPGTYRVKVSVGFGFIDRVTIDDSGDHLKLIDIEQWGTLEWSSMFSAFAACQNLTTISATDSPDLTNVTTLSYMFGNCSQLVHVPGMENWDVSDINDFVGMFQQYTVFNQYIGGWDISGANDISTMFYGCQAFNQDISNWNVSNIVSMFSTFNGARSFNQDISGWDVSNVIYMHSLFFDARVFNQDISSWDVSSVTVMGEMFWDAFAFNQDISGWDVSNVIDMYNMFAGTTVFNQDIGGWDVSEVTDMNHMFLGASAFNQDIGDWDVGNVTNMEGMFVGADNFNADIGRWNVSQVVNMSNMFLAAPVFNQDLSAWDVSQVSDMSSMFAEAPLFNQSLGAWELRDGVNLSGMLNTSGIDCSNYSKTLLGWAGNPGTPDDLVFGAVGLQYGSDASPSRNTLLSKGWTITDNGIDNACPFMKDPCITIWKTDEPGASNTNQILIPALGNGFNIYWEEVGNTSNQGSLTGNGHTTITFPSIGTYCIIITPGAGTFGGMTFNNSVDKLKLLVLDQWGTTPWTVAANAFHGCENLKVTAVDIPVFSGVTSMRNMFRSSTNLTSVPNINAWNTTPVTDMGGMFANALLFQSNLGGWDVSNVAYMDSMFYGAANFNSDIDAWNVSDVINMSYMFRDASSFDQNIGAWNTSAVTNMKYMFYNAVAFNRIIGEWNLSGLIPANNAIEGMLSFSGMDCRAYSFTLIGWSVNAMTPNGLNLGAESLMYSAEATFAKNDLLSNHNWTITDDGTDANCELYSDKFITIWQTTNTGVSANNQILIPATGSNFSIYWEQVNNTAINGTATGNNATTLTFPANGTYRVKISPGSGTFNRINFAATGDRLKLMRIENWGSIPWSNFSNAFNGCTNMTITATDTVVLSSCNNLSAMFQNCGSLTTVPSIHAWPTTTITNMSLMFYGASNFNEPIGSWNTGNVVNMNYMFFEAVTFNQPIGSWNVSKVTNMSQMFEGAAAFNQPIGNWNTILVTNMSRMFQNAFSFNQDLNSWNVSKVTNMNSMFLGAISFNGNISNWNTILVTNMGSMFSDAVVFNRNIGSWNTGNVTSMFGTFNGALAFNQNIGNWNTIKVTSMFVMFQDAVAFNQNIGGWNTMNVTAMNSMFNGATSFNQDISNWNISKVLSMSGMFSGATSFNQDIGNWNVSKVTDMASMFNGATAFNHNIGDWDIRKVTSMGAMFRNASSFNQDLGDWQFAPTVSLLNMLSNSGLDCDNYSPSLIGWAANDSTPVNRVLGALDIRYLREGLVARDFLVTTKGWTITDGGRCPFPVPQAYVDADAMGINKGTSWADAFTNLQDALLAVDFHPNLNDVWMAEGTYYPASTSRDSSFVLSDSVKIYGGFLGIEDELADRSTDASLVIISGDVGVLNDSTDNSYHIFVSESSCLDCRLDAITISSGYATPSSVIGALGAGLHNAGTLTLHNCILERNTSSLEGSAIYNHGALADLLISGCTLRLNNSAQSNDVVNAPGGDIQFMGVNLVKD